jgi:RimJ/RimL family protein N-acetyltransferase
MRTGTDNTYNGVMTVASDTLIVRPLRRGERGAVAAVFAGLSERSRFFRFLAPVRELAPRQLEHLADVGCCGREAVVATEPATAAPVGIARYVRDDERPDTAEVAFEVVDAWQGRGVGTRLAQALARRAARDGVHRFEATVASDNTRALALLRSLGPVERAVRDGTTLELTIALCR